MKQEEIQKNAMHKMCSKIRRLPFKEYAEKFELQSIQKQFLLL